MGFSVETYTTSPGTTVIRCAGELDVAAGGKLIDAIELADASDLQSLRIDLTDVSFIDSTGLGCLIHGSLRCAKQGVDFAIVPGKATADVISRTRVGAHLPVATDVPGRPALTRSDG